MSSTNKTEGQPQARGLIGLGDLTRALIRLDSRDPDTIERIARALGFTGIDANPAEAAQGVSGGRRRSRIAPRTGSKGPPQRGGVPRSPAPVALPDQVYQTEMTAVETEDTMLGRPEWLEHGPGLGDTRFAAMPRAKLISDRSGNGVLGAAVATRRSGQSPDLRRMIYMIVRGGVLTSLPYRPNPSVHRGVQLLMDTSEAMTPFLEDLDDLAQSMVRVLGRNACELFEFGGDPSRAVRWSVDLREIRWRPVAGRPIVVASDFGIGAKVGARDSASQQAWLRFQRRAHAAGVPVIAFVPHGRDRWRKSLTRRIHFIHWDPRTRASNVRKLFGIGHEVGP